jgi:hypothetical protein
MDLAALFTYNVKAALARSKEVTMFTLDMQRAFDTVGSTSVATKVHMLYLCMGGNSSCSI